jgi:hypothetical protein
MDDQQSKYKKTEIADIPQAPNYYPNLLWHRQTDRYWNYWYYYDGEKLDEEVEGGITESGDTALKYPLKINRVKMAVQKHAFCLLGEYDETGILEFHAKRKRGQRSEGEGIDDPVAQEVDSFLEDVWDENNAMNILPEQARIAHVCGGCVFKVAYDGRKKNKVRLEVILPDYFFPVWDGGDYHNLLEAIISYQIPTVEAIHKYGLNPDSTTGDTVLYQEKWDKDKYEITVDGKPAISPHGIPYSGKNIYVDPETGEGIIPFEYLPVDRTGEFYGTSIIPGAMGLQDEYNVRLADIGDAVNEAVHPLRFGRNLPKQRKDIKLSRYKIVNLGQNPPNQDAPEVGYVEHPGLPTGTNEFIDELKGAFREVAHTPPVAYGIDEGSQRSALTLAFRMWPTTSFTRDTRATWNSGLASLNRKMMIVHIVKTAKESRITADHLAYTLMTIWPPIIPRDREQHVSENILLVQARLRSPETALRNLGDIDDIDAEIERIKQWQDYLASLVAQQASAQQEAKGEVAPPEAQPVVE